jgi:DNA-directed RNA polymerase subunit F
MKAYDMNKNEFDITREEAERIAGELAKLGGHETNKAFMERAQNNIAAVAGFKPTSEDELKMVLYKNLRGPSMPEIEILVEAMEYVAAMHKQKVG